VEHYWDSYIRYRYLGDIEFLFLGKLHKNDLLMTPLGFPTTEKFIADLTKKLSQLNKISILSFTKEELENHFNNKKAKERMIESLKEEEVKIKIEKAFIFPRIFCDRVIRGQITPFLYDIVVRGNGAYEESIMFPSAITEKTSYQMEGPKVNHQRTYNENKKLGFFASPFNEAAKFTGISFNFLNYFICPNLENLQLYGNDVFYHTRALKPFVESALTVGNAFIRDLSNGIKSESLGNLGKFWNLDTGLGIEVKNIPSDTRFEVITELNFIHVTEAVQSSRIKYTKDNNPAYLRNKTTTTYNESQVETRAYDTYKGGPFKSRKDIFERPDNLSSRRYLDQIILRPPEKHIPLSTCTIKSFFSNPRKVENSPQPVATKKNQKGGNVLQVDDVKHRLALNIKMPIAEITDKEHLGFYVNNDIDSSASEKQKLPDAWLIGTSVTDFTKTKNVKNIDGRFKRDGGLCFFQTQLLMNLDNRYKREREVIKTKWNNVIEQPHRLCEFSRNYCVGTGRENVLHPIGNGTFNGRTHFAVYSDVSPTEQIFFTLYHLMQAKDGKCYDMLTRFPVEKKELDTIKRIDALGFVKIVLFYELSTAGAMQVKECLIDGLPVQVKTGIR
jgi:hypothetical protein